MKVLFVRTKKRRPDNASMRHHLEELVDYHDAILSKFWERKLRFRFLCLDFSQYDAVIFDLRFKNIFEQTSFFKENCKKTSMFFLEEDACQDFINESPWYGEFSKFYKSIDAKRVICTGYNTEKMLVGNGIKATMVPKGYDNEKINDLGLKRDIEFGFIGKLESAVYKNRKKIINDLSDKLDLVAFRTKPGDEYMQGLNKINYFVTADAGLGEYMVKNFEAMAAGCILVAYRIGSGEESALGFKDMENIVLYRDTIELSKKINKLKRDKSLCEKIRTNGKRLAKENLSFKAQAEKIVEIISCS